MIRVAMMASVVLYAIFGKIVGYPAARTMQPSSYLFATTASGLIVGA